MWRYLIALASCKSNKYWINIRITVLIYSHQKVRTLKIYVLHSLQVMSYYLFAINLPYSTCKMQMTFAVTKSSNFNSNGDI